MKPNWLWSPVDIRESAHVGVSADRCGSELEN